MPVFFFAGGAANLHSYTAHLDRGGNARSWLAARLCRLTVPVLPLLAVWLVVPNTLLRGLGMPDQPVALAAGIVGQLLWFLAVYVLTVAAVPIMHVATGGGVVAVPVVLGAGALGVDALRFHGLPLIGYVNEVLVWLAISQLGLGLRARAVRAAVPAAALAMGCAGFAGTAALVLVRSGTRPAWSGCRGRPCRTWRRPRRACCASGVGQVGLLLARAGRDRAPGQATRADRRPRCMTVYLWHMTALVVVAGIAVLGFGYATPAPGSARLAGRHATVDRRGSRS